MSKFATYLTDIVKMVESVKTYCSTVCAENEIRGFRPVRKGIKFHRAIAGIRRRFHHKIKRAVPLTPQLLEEIQPVVQVRSDKELVAWVSLLTGFNLLLRKSNMVPLKRVQDSVHNISRKDVRYGNSVMVFVIGWSKTNQHGEEEQTPPLIMNKESDICPVRWLLYMMKRFPAEPNHNLFSLYNKFGQVVPLTYRDLMTNMRKWLKLIGCDASKIFVALDA